MKKLLLSMLCLGVLFGCSNAPSEGSGQTDTNEQESTVQLPYGTDTGTGTMYLSTAGGTTEDGNVPDVLTSEKTSLKQIGINTSDFNGENFSFVYIDGTFISKEQYADSQSTLDLEGDFLKEGEHTVSVIQYDTNDETGEIITYKEAKYNIVY